MIINIITCTQVKNNNKTNKRDWLLRTSFAGKHNFHFSRVHLTSQVPSVSRRLGVCPRSVTSLGGR